MHEMKLRKGPWAEKEDEQLAVAVAILGDRRWDALAKSSGLRRSGKSCRLRWMNYLRPDLKHGNITPQEEHLINELQNKWGNKWSKIAKKLPGRTDNEIKNYWKSSSLKNKGSVIEKKYNSECETTGPISLDMLFNDDILGPSIESEINNEIKRLLVRVSHKLFYLSQRFRVRAFGNVDVLNIMRESFAANVVLHRFGVIVHSATISATIKEKEKLNLEKLLLQWSKFLSSVNMHH